MQNREWRIAEYLSLARRGLPDGIVGLCRQLDTLDANNPDNIKIIKLVWNEMQGLADDSVAPIVELCERMRQKIDGSVMVLPGFEPVPAVEARIGQINMLLVDDKAFAATLKVEARGSEEVGHVGFEFSCTEEFKESARSGIRAIRKLISSSMRRRGIEFKDDSLFRCRYTCDPQRVRLSGPSAGLASALVRLSEYLHIPIDQDWFVTGEIESSGELKAIGDFSEKIRFALNVSPSSRILVPETKERWLDQSLRGRVIQVGKLRDAASVVFKQDYKSAIDNLVDAAALIELKNLYSEGFVLLDDEFLANLELGLDKYAIQHSFYRNIGMIEWTDVLAGTPIQRDVIHEVLTAVSEVRRNPSWGRRPFWISLTGSPSSGKSSLMKQVAIHLASEYVWGNQSPPILFASTQHTGDLTLEYGRFARLTGRPFVIMVDGIDRATVIDPEQCDEDISELPLLLITTSEVDRGGYPAEQAVNIGRPDIMIAIKPGLSTREKESLRQKIDTVYSRGPYNRQKIETMLQKAESVSTLNISDYVTILASGADIWELGDQKRSSCSGQTGLLLHLDILASASKYGLSVPKSLLGNASRLVSGGLGFSSLKPLLLHTDLVVENGDHMLFKSKALATAFLGNPNDAECRIDESLGVVLQTFDPSARPHRVFLLHWLRLLSADADACGILLQRIEHDGVSAIRESASWQQLIRIWANIYWRLANAADQGTQEGRRKGLQYLRQADSCFKLGVKRAGKRAREALYLCARFELFERRNPKKCIEFIDKAFDYNGNWPIPDYQFVLLEAKALAVLEDYETAANELVKYIDQQVSEGIPFHWQLARVAIRMYQKALHRAELGPKRSKAIQSSMEGLIYRFVRWEPRKRMDRLLIGSLDEHGKRRIAALFRESFDSLLAEEGTADHVLLGNYIRTVSRCHSLPMLGSAAQLLTTLGRNGDIQRDTQCRFLHFLIQNGRESSEVKKAVSSFITVSESLPDRMVTHRDGLLEATMRRMPVVFYSRVSATRVVSMLLRIFDKTIVTPSRVSEVTSLLLAADASPEYFSQARRVLDQMVSIEQQNWPGLNERQRRFLRIMTVAFQAILEENEPEAVATLERTLDAKPDTDLSLGIVCGWTMVRLGEYKKCSEIMEQLIIDSIGRDRQRERIDTLMYCFLPLFVRPIERREFVYSDFGGSTKEILERLVYYDALSVHSKYNAAAVVARAGKRDAAQKFLEEVVESSPLDIKHRVYAAGNAWTMYRKSGNPVDQSAAFFRKAEKYFEDAIDIAQEKGLSPWMYYQVLSQYADLLQYEAVAGPGGSSATDYRKIEELRKLACKNKQYNAIAFHSLAKLYLEHPTEFDNPTETYDRGRKCLLFSVKAGGTSPLPFLSLAELPGDLDAPLDRLILYLLAARKACIKLLQPPRFLWRQLDLYEPKQLALDSLNKALEELGKVTLPYSTPDPRALSSAICDLGVVVSKWDDEKSEWAHSENSADVISGLMRMDRKLSAYQDDSFSRSDVGQTYEKVRTTDTLS